MTRRMKFLAILLILGVGMGGWAADTPVALRVAHFTVPPATGPVAHVVIENRLDTVYEGTVHLTLPAGWHWSPTEQPVVLEPQETKRLPFAIEKATNTQTNRYAVQVYATSANGNTTREQHIVCASAPYFSPKIDGDLNEWEDAPPVRFVQDGKETIVRTFWNRRDFFLGISVENDQHTGSAETPGDAIQFSLAPKNTVTGDTGDAPAARYEFLVAGGGGRRAKTACYQLMKPDMPLSKGKSPRELAELMLEGAQVAIKSKKGHTYYECAIPFSVMPTIRAMEGREFNFSIIVHDPDGTGVRDWGAHAGLWPWQRNARAWSVWEGADWGEEPPYDGKIEWGLCSSIH